MIRCEKCGAELEDNAKFCSVCGARVEKDDFFVNSTNPTRKADENRSIVVAAEIFMILGCVLSAFVFLIPLIWTIPMTVYAYNRLERREPIGVGFKICSLLFVSLIAGILLLVLPDEY